MQTEHLQLQKELDPEQLRHLRRIIAEGGLVAYPTESFYGLGADPWNEAAVDRVRRLKGDRGNKPLPLVLGSTAAALRVARTLPASLAVLAERFWPGPLTIVVPARDDLPQQLTAGGATVALRVPGHPLARTLARLAGGAMTSTSANRSGAPPPSTAAAVDEQLGGQIEVIVSVEPAAPSTTVPSTIVDLCGSEVRILRLGAIDAASIEACLGGLPDSRPIADVAPR